MRLSLAIFVVVVLLATFYLTLQRPDHAAPTALNDARVGLSEVVQGELAEFAPENVTRVSLIADDQTPAEVIVTESEGVAVEAVLEPVDGLGDLEARSPIVIRVLDELDAPVADASVEIWGMRRVDDPGSHFDYRGDPPSGSTDAEGRVHLEHWDWVTIDGRTGELTINIEHPDFVTFSGDFALRPGEHVVHLERGATVVVTGWIGDPANAVHDLTLRVDRESNLGEGAWHTLPDGRKAISRLPPGPHWIVATHMHPKLGRMSSAPEHFEVGQLGWETLHLELHPPLDFVGQLDAVVPRPIIGGHVQLVLTSGGLGESRINLSDSYEAPVDADGRFVIENVRPGGGQIFALCSGWSSIETLADDPLQAGIQFHDEVSEEVKREALAAKGSRAFILQRAQFPQVATPFVVLMQRTSSLEVTVLGPDGSPVEGAMLGATRGANGRRRQERTASRASTTCRRTTVSCTTRRRTECE